MPSLRGSRPFSVIIRPSVKAAPCPETGKDPLFLKREAVSIRLSR